MQFAAHLRRPCAGHRSSRRRGVAAAAALLIASAPAAQAMINNVNHAELALTIWDPIGQVSYTKDLGIDVTQFFNYAQSDDGYQQFWRINGATDAALSQLLAVGTAASSLYWAMTADDTEGTGDPNDFNMYTTLTQGQAAGVLNPTYSALIDTTAATTVSALQAYGFFLGAVNNAPRAAYNTQGTTFDDNGSTFSRKSENGYFDNNESWHLAPGYLVGSGSVSSGYRGVVNKVGQSSWFYKLTNASYDSSDATFVDEFDNLGHDGYWGLAVDPANGDYVLSYTLVAASLAKMSTTAAGMARVQVTEYRASIGNAHAVFTPTVEFADYAGLSMAAAVPEPSTWALSLAGLAAVGWAARRRRG